ncbi:MAG: glycosyltransferase [Oligoflexia bacterium]|nr:glycosyltransferase [Oligoflexia bacterium]
MSVVGSSGQASTKSPGRVLLIAPQPFFLNRGTPMNVRAMATALAEFGLAVDLLVYPIGDEIDIPGVRILRCPRLFGIRSVPIGPSWKKAILDIGLAIHALFLAITRRYQVIQGVEEAGVIAWGLSRLSGARCIFDMDSCMVTQIENSGFLRSRLLLWLVAAIESFCLRRSDAVITVCSSLTAKVRQLAPEAQIYQIEDFPLDDAQVPNQETIVRLTNELSLQGRSVILYTGNLEPYQGVELLITAFHKITLNTGGATPPVLVIVGGNQSQVAQLRAQVTQLGIDGHVRITGARPLAEMGSFMALASVLASPRLVGTNTPLKLYSYMAAARPIVATSIISHTQVLDNSCAYLADPNPNDFSLALQAALEKSDAALRERQTRVEQSLQLVQTRYSRNTFTHQLRSLYSRLIGKTTQLVDSQVQHEPVRS